MYVQMVVIFYLRNSHSSVSEWNDTGHKQENRMGHGQAVVAVVDPICVTIEIYLFEICGKTKNRKKNTQSLSHWLDLICVQIAKKWLVLVSIRNERNKEEATEQNEKKKFK